MGRGIDIGCGDDPVTPDCLHWDRGQGDAQTLPGLVPVSLDWVTCVSVLDHIEDKAGFCRDLDTLPAPIALTFELAYSADLVTMLMVYDCLAQFQHHYLRKMEVCPVWADNSGFGQWRPLRLVLDMNRGTLPIRGGGYTG